MCQVPHRPPCLAATPGKEECGNYTLNTPLDVLGPVEAWRPWEGGEGKWGVPSLEVKGRGTGRDIHGGETRKGAFEM